MRSIIYTQYRRRLLHLTVGCLALNATVLPGPVAAHGIPPLTSAGELHALQQAVSGTVADDSGVPLVGVTITEKGTDRSTTTDADGNFRLTVSSANAILVFSSIGYVPQEIALSGRQSIAVTLEPALNTLDELVVVGYGTQKKRLTTGATVQVKGEDLQRLSTGSALNAMQSQSPGVQITQSSGMPGEGFNVNIRGIGTIGQSQPLYVIDGAVGGDINSLNPTDIESIDILKDAASAAIYGARAANGVVLVTTRRGRSGRMTLNYDAYYGWQNAYKIPSLLNAQEYMAIQDERRFNDGLQPYNWANEIPVQYEQIVNGTWNGTNWLKEGYNGNAPTQNHAVNLSGGNERSTFAFGYSNNRQEGIFGRPVEPQFNRHTVRLNSEHVIWKNDDFDVLKFGENVTYAYNTRAGVGIGNIYWNDINNMLKANPLLPMHNSEGNYYDQASKQADRWGLDGAAANPIALMEYERGQNISKNHSIMANAFLELQPIKDLRFRSNFGYRLNASSFRSYVPAFDLSSFARRSPDEIHQNQSQGYRWLWENTVAYQREVGDGHHFDALLGQSMEKIGIGEDLSVTNTESSFPGSWRNAWISNGTGAVRAVGGTHWPEDAIASFFGRVLYNYKETYLASVIMRADGSANFARGNRWGYFPSFSAGWVMTNESFMQPAASWLNFFKIRGSWGQNGNSFINNFQYLATIAIDTQNGYYFGNNKGSLIRGAYPDILANPDVSWETSEQLNIGFDARLMRDRLGVVFDWYRKTTKDWLVEAPVLASYGTNPPFINGGDIENKGVELGLNWSDTQGDFTYGISLNGAYNKNTVTRIANAEGIIHGEPSVLSQGTTAMYRAQVGYPVGYFFGYQTAGVFQNAEQIADYRARGLGIIDDVQPGDLIFVDTNGDGAITEADKTMIGNPHPDFTAGMNLNFGYKGFDLNVTAYGSFGHQIAKSYRSFADSPLQNYTTEVFQRWHGEGTSNRYPRITAGGHPNAQYISDIYIEEADFIRIQNVTFGYNLKSAFPKMPFGQARVYVAAQNLYTFTGYSGMDPEIGYGDDRAWVSGIDVGFYPSPRNFLVGLNLTF
ncbi:SusC/RagA family TonB-linked outer membrane protein [Parapedobacter deserti]|uniref:SusC/RagA family TonB-linked outer membrane protein n=1 Tax=Parapedobacter deserti TaxID=1912957 RepID=A0ABV7JUM9_9SPHI